MAGDRLLIDLLEGNTHAHIRCRCHRVVLWRSRDLIEKFGRDATVKKAQTRMICQQCRCRGWASIEPAQR